MNSNFLRAASKDSKQTLLTRSWKRSLMLALVTLCAYPARLQDRACKWEINRCFALAG